MKTLAAVGFLLVLGCNREPCEPEPAMSRKEACLLIAEVACNTCSESGPLGGYGLEETPEECLAQARETRCERWNNDENGDYNPRPIDWPDCLDECLARWGTKNDCVAYAGEELPYACRAIFEDTDRDSAEKYCTNGPFHESECGYTLAE